MITFTIKAPAAPLARGETWYILAHLVPDAPPIVAAICNNAAWATKVKLGLEKLEAARHSRTPRPTRSTHRLRQATT